MVEENIQVAQTHLSQDPSIMGHVKYIHGAVEDLVGTEEGRFDAIVASEVVEHVSDVSSFLSSCCKLIKVCVLLILSCTVKLEINACIQVDFIFVIIHPLNDF